MGMPKLSIIVPVYNVQNDIKRCIDSILRQEFKDYELLLIDDGSTDQSGVICDEYSSLDKRITVYHKKNGGQSSARNIGLNKAKGDYITFVDSDDLIKDYKTYSLLVDYLERNTDIDIIQYPHQQVENSHIIKTKICPPQLITSIEEFFLLLDWSNLLGEKGVITGLVWDKIFRKNCIGSTRFDEDMIYEDTHFLLKVFERAKQIYISDKGMYWYFQRPNSTTTTKKVTPFRRISFLKMTTSVHQALTIFSPNSKCAIANLYLFILEYYIYTRYLFPQKDLSLIKLYMSNNIPMLRGATYNLIKIAVLRLIGINLYEKIALTKYRIIG